MKPEILTSGGLYFDFLNPDPARVIIEDIAHGLSHICRFTGHCRTFYSVAQHSVLVSYTVPPEHALAGLLHDAAEAYIGDVSSPLKQFLPEYKAIESRLEAAVFGAFGLPPVLPPEVKHADLILLATEKRDLMPSVQVSRDVERTVSPLAETIVPWSPEEARHIFLLRFYDLAGFGDDA